MTRQKEDRGAYLGALLAARSKADPKNASAIYRISANVATLRRYAKTLRHFAEVDCNTGLTPAQEKRRDNLARSVAEIAALYGMGATCQGDPRGPVVRLTAPEGETGFVGDGWAASDGWAVY
jgi:hypothetical protein